MGVPHPLGTSEAPHVGLSSSPMQKVSRGVRRLKPQGDTSAREQSNPTVSYRTTVMVVEQEG